MGLFYLSDLLWEVWRGEMADCIFIQFRDAGFAAMFGRNSDLVDSCSLALYIFFYALVSVYSADIS